MERGRQGRREAGKEGGREGGKQGRREAWNEGGREGGRQGRRDSGVSRFFFRCPETPPAKILF